MVRECIVHVVRWIRCVTVEPVLFLYMFASSLTFSAFQAMTYEKCCLTLYNQTMCEELNANKSLARELKMETDAIQTLTSSWMMKGNIAVTVPATVVLLLFLGSWGDRVGRRLPLVVSCVAAMAYTVINILNAVFMSTPLAYTLIGPIFSGLGGSYLAVLMASYTYLTHLAGMGSRMTRVGVAESAVFLSSTISVFVSGQLVDTLGFVPTFAIILGFQALALLYTLILLPEIKTRGTTTTNNSTTTITTTTTPTTTPPSFSSVGDKVTCCRGAWCLTSLRDMWLFVRTARGTRVKVHLALFVLVLNILQLTTTGELDILLLYLKRSPRNWSYTTYGYFKGTENFTRGAAVLILLPLLKKMASPRDTTLILAGLVSKTAGLVLLGLATQTWTVFLVVGVACLQGFPSAGLRSLMSSLVHKEEQGRLFGLVAATESVVSFIATLIFNGIYPKTLSFYDGFSFQLAAGFVFICFVIVVCQHVDLIKSSDGFSFQRIPESPSSSAVSDAASSQVVSAAARSLHHDASGADLASYGSADASLESTSPRPNTVQRTEDHKDDDDAETDFVK